MKTVDPRKSGYKKRLEDIQLPLERPTLEKSFSDLNGRMTPEVFEWRMAPSKLVGGNAEEEVSSPWEELRADRPCRLRYVTHVESAAGSTNDCVTNFPPGAIVDIVEETKRVVRETNNKMHRSGWQNPLSNSKHREW